MSTKSRKRFVVHLSTALCMLLIPLLLTTASLVSNQGQVEASSHREAPLISQDAYADGTDTYVFVSPKNPDNLVLVGSWIPFEGPEGGPNYFEWGNGVLYSIHVDNNGDAKADYTYTLSSKVDVKNPLTFLYNTGPIGNDGANWNRQQRITITESSTGGDKTLVNDKLTAPVNIGNKSTPNFADLEKSFTYTVNDDGDDIKIYAGQVDDAFWVDLQVFDLLTLRGQQPPVGYSSGNNDPVDSVAGFNNHSMVIEVPISRLTQGTETVLGVWATASRPATRVLKGAAGLGALENSGDAIQVSRLGMPLVNEVVIPLALKDAFNSIDPSLDLPIYTDALGEDVGALLQRSVEDPEIGRLLCALYAIPLPGDADDNCSTEVDIETPRSGRGDIFDIFLTGMKLAAPFTIQTKNGPVTLPAGFNVNQPANVVPAEVIRINTAIKGDLCSPTPSRLGVLGGDACGFPNGRRLFDDIVEIELLAVAGAAYPVLDGRDTSFSFNPAFIDVLDDGIDFNDRPFRSEFPYMALAQSGQEHIHDNPTGQSTVESATATIQASRDDAEESKRGSVYFTSRDLDLGDEGKTIGLHFAAVNVPPGATIQKAHIAFVAKGSDNKATSLQFVAEAADNAGAFSDARSNVSGRTKTSANVAWDDVPAWKKNEKYWTPDLSAVIQEVVSRGGWSANNAINIIVTGTGEREPWSYDGSAQLAPVLYIEYSTSATTAAAASDGMAAGTSVLSSSIWRSEVDPATVVEPEGVDEDETVDAQEAGSEGNTDTTQSSKAYLPIVTE